MRLGYLCRLPTGGIARESSPRWRAECAQTGPETSERVFSCAYGLCRCRPPRRVRKRHHRFESSRRINPQSAYQKILPSPCRRRKLRLSGCDVVRTALMLRRMGGGPGQLKSLAPTMASLAMQPATHAELVDPKRLPC